jgi:hypothetical protein
VRPGGVLVGDILPQHLLQMAPPKDEDPIETLAAHTCHPALGDRVRAQRLGRCPHCAHVLHPKHRVEGCRELGISVVDQGGEAPAFVLKLPAQVAGLLGDSGGGGVLRAAGHRHVPSLELDEEQHERGLQSDDIDREQITGEHACAVRTEERAPGSAGPPRRRRDPVPPQQGPDRGRGDAMPQLEQFATDPLVAPARVLGCQPQDYIGADGRPGRRRRPKTAHCRRTNFRCQRRRISGGTGNAGQWARGRQRLGAVSTRRSPGRQAMRLVRGAGPALRGVGP